MLILQDRELWWKFETLVRDLLVAALRKVPSDEASRRSYLASLYDPDDEVRAGRVEEEVSAIKNQNVREKLLNNLNVALKTQ